MRPATAYRRINRTIWLNRLPVATIIFVDKPTMPNCYGVTLDDDGVFEQPVIVLNSAHKRWGKTLIHEMIHIAEPSLCHGLVFEALVNRYWRIAKAELKDWSTQ
jgi:hypothetical protein